VIGQPTQGVLQQVSGTAQAPVVFGLGQQPGEQVPDPGGGRAQPVVFVVEAQQHLGHGQTDQLGIGDGGWAARAGTAPWPQGGDDSVGQLHVQCDEESVQVGDHEGLQGPTCVNTPILGTLRHPRTPSHHQPPIHINDLVS
jgi:hypothetical protein